ncbi:MAG: RecQ family ATP-dependent DNA helicase, partial [Proteobacteria bacterium]|nr:RecQ family ATP-dependent DNA helicase [Pseudomonadota bacterium]
MNDAFESFSSKFFLSSALIIDLETTYRGKIIQIGALLGDKEFHQTVEGPPVDALHHLEIFADDAKYLLGHNLLGHDLGILSDVFPGLKILDLPIIDTLYLSPLAFPKNPYHHLIKGYKLIRSGMSNPVKDCKLSVRLFKDEIKSFCNILEKESELIKFYRFCFEENVYGDWTTHGFSEVFNRLLGEGTSTIQEIGQIFLKKSTNQGCKKALQNTVDSLLPDPVNRPMLAYSLAWLQVAGSNSVLPEWVRHQFPEISNLLKNIREKDCEDPTCTYCHETHDPVKQLQNLFGFEAFRAIPADEAGNPLQQVIVKSGMEETSLMAILPTGGGKSICFQIPALVRYLRRGVLTVVISPLQALMKDQVDNLKVNTGTPYAEAIYGMLTAPERGAILERVRLGDTAILYISPEQLRNNSVINALKQREVACWVFDEAHCLSKWGHDFRSDYLYASRFIREFSIEKKLPVPSIECFTATAKRSVLDEIQDHFKGELAIDMLLFEGGIERDNLNFEVQLLNSAEKFERICNILESRWEGREGSVVIYASSRKRTEGLSEFLNSNGFKTNFFHAGLQSELKREVLDQFSSGECSVVCATNAFGMGIDKDNVRHVIHHDIPGS